MVEMKTPEIPDRVEREIAAKFADGIPIDDILLYMQAQGLFAIPSIKMVRKYAGVSLGRAQDIVSNSPVWASMFPTTPAAAETSQLKKQVA